MRILKKSLLLAPFVFMGLVGFSNIHTFHKETPLKNTKQQADSTEVYYTQDGRLVTKELAANYSKSKTKVNTKDLSAFDKMVFNEFLSLDEGTFEKPNLEAFKTAIKGYYNLKDKGVITSDYLTLIDFSKSSTQRRMWVIDMQKKKILFHNVVSHGKNSGREFAESFSNTPESHQSSIGFYKTAEIYNGSNGLSLRLDGLEAGFNDNARTRAIVMHGANYCDEELANRQGYLGRSYGCPSIPRDLTPKIINTIKNGSCLFIYHKNQNFYLKNSKLL